MYIEFELRESSNARNASSYFGNSRSFQSVLAVGVEWEAVTQMRAINTKRFHDRDNIFSFQDLAYPGDLNVVQLLLPVENALHPVHPHVDISNQDRLANPLN